MTGKEEGRSDIGIEDLISRILGYNPNSDVEMIRRAYSFAEETHRGRMRNSGDPYITHCLATAEILAELEMDDLTISAAILHDTMEDGGVRKEEIEERFGAKIAELVDGVTVIGSLGLRTEWERQVEEWRKMLLAMAKDVRVILIKLADRLHNMRTLQYLEEDKRRRIAQETLDIYAPLAGRLGIWRLKWELEDLAFRYLKPKEYYELARRVASKRREREEYVERVKEMVREKLREAGISAEVQGRAKHLFSIYQKMLRQGRDFDEIHDLIGIRILTEEESTCYTILSLVHSLWIPIPGTLDDYIARPKGNNYRSLHTTVIGPAGRPLEVQIRTYEMHRDAETGIAAHWRYKERGRKGEDEKRIAWLRQLLEWLRELKNPREFMESLKDDIIPDRVYVFTPKGEIKELPVGSTPIDFAYAVHTEIGHRCVAAKVNGAMVPLRYELKNGDIVEIITSPHSRGPSRDWLKIVKTARARTKIRQWFRMMEYEENVARGREALEKELSRVGMSLAALQKEGKLDLAAGELGFKEVDDLFAAIGFQEISARQVLTKIVPVEEIRVGRRERKGSGPGVRVDGLDCLSVRLARCCSPIPYDKIVGIVTKVKGITIHRDICPNARVAWARKVDAEWNPVDGEYYDVIIEADAYDRAKLLENILNAISDTRTTIKEARAKALGNGITVSRFTISVRDDKQLQEVMAKIKRVRGVTDVRRYIPGEAKAT
jgi:GTP pyrophosphokinase